MTSQAQKTACDVPNIMKWFIQSAVGVKLSYSGR
jgi:hypothetical protein